MHALQLPKTILQPGDITVLQALPKLKCHECEVPAPLLYRAVWSRHCNTLKLKATQGSRRDLSTDPENIIALCRAHHVWTGHHPTFGRLLGTYGTTIKHPEENPPT